MTLVGSGSSAAQPYMLKLFKGYSQIHRTIHFRYSPDGGNAGVQDVQQGRSQFAIQTRPPLRSDSGTTYFKLFLDGLCIVVNPNNSLSDISISETKNIFLATDTNWSQVPGSNLTTTIDPVGRNSAAGLYTFFQQAVLGGKTQASNVNPLTVRRPRRDRCQQRRERDRLHRPLALRCAAVGVKKLTIGGVPCDAAHIKNESYPLFRYDWGVLPTVAGRTSRSRSSSTGSAPARPPARSSPGPARSPRSTSTRKKQGPHGRRRPPRGGGAPVQR